MKLLNIGEALFMKDLENLRVCGISTRLRIGSIVLYSQTCRNAAPSESRQ
jgi:hypothetical protein